MKAPRHVLLLAVHSSSNNSETEYLQNYKQSGIQTPIWIPLSYSDVQYHGTGIWITNHLNNVQVEVCYSDNPALQIPTGIGHLAERMKFENLFNDLFNTCGSALQKKKALATDIW